MTLEEAVQEIGRIIPCSLNEEHGARIAGVVSGYATQRAGAERERCINAVCEWCRNGIPFDNVNWKKNMVHEGKKYKPCIASGIRAALQEPT